MSRIFLSHASKDGRASRALKQWLSEQDPPLANEIFLDTDRETGIQSGNKWQDELMRASARCEAVVCLLSQNWENSRECQVEYRTAENLGKQIFPARLEPEPAGGSSITSEWQRCDLFGGDHQTEVDLGDGNPPVQFSTDGLMRLRDGIRGAGISAESFVWPPKGDADRSPYRGWYPFEEVDAGVFFGRDGSIVKGMDALRAMRRESTNLLVILGPSGAGKSSFLRAGLLPRLRREDRRFLVLDVVRPARGVLTGDSGLAQAILNARNSFRLDTPPDLGDIKGYCQSDHARVRELLADCQRAAADRLPDIGDSDKPPTVVLPLDQAEELFTAGAGVQARQFLELIKNLAIPGDGPGFGFIVAATIRSDCYEPMQTAPELSDVPARLFHELKPMQPFSFTEVITGPAERSAASTHAFTIEPDLVDKLVQDCAKGIDTLPILSLTLSRLYQDYAGDGVISLAEYEDHLGGIGQIVEVEVNDILSDDPAARKTELDLLRDAFIPWLVTVGLNGQPLRRQADWADIPQAARPLLDKFIDKRLLVKQTSDEQTTVEVTLESLLTEWTDLSEWLGDEAENLKTTAALERDFAEWEASGHSGDYLLPPNRLKEGERLAATTRYGMRLANIHGFLAESRTAVNQKLESDLRRTRILLGTAVAFLVIAIVAAFIARHQTVAANHARDDADHARELAEHRYHEAVSLRLVSEAQAMLAGTRSEGDARGFQQLLAAGTLINTPDDGAVFSAAVQRLNTLKIIRAPEIARSAVFSPDGKRIASASLADRTVRIWDADTGRPVGTPVLAHTDKVWSVAYSADGHRLVSASGDGTLRVWDADTGTSLGPPLQGHTDQVFSAAFSPDGRRIVSGGADKTIRIWDTQTGRQLGATLVGHTGAVWSVAFSPDGRRVVSGSADHTIRMWDVDSGRPASPVMRGHGDVVWSVVFSPDGQRILSASSDYTAREWNTRTGEQIGAPLSGHANSVASAAFSPDGRRIVSGSADDTIRIWDADSHQPIGAPLVGHNNGVMSVSFSPDGARIVSASTDNTVRLWDAANVQPGGRVVGAHGGPALAVAFSPDSSRIASGGADNLIRLWNLRADQPNVPPLQGHTATVSSVAFNADGSRLVSGGADGTVRLWDVRAGQQLGQPLRGHRGNVRGVAMSPKGDRIVSGGADGTLRVWAVGDSSTVIDVPNAHGGKEVSSVAFNAAGDRIVTGGDDGMVRLWDAGTGSPVGAPLIAPGLATSHDGAVTSVAFSPDGSRIVSGSIDTTERVWDVATGSQLGAQMTAHQGTVTDVAFSPDGQRILTGSVDRTVRLWNAASGKPFGEPMRGHQEWVLSVAFSPDGRSVASSSGDGTVRVWPAEVTNEDLCNKLTANMSHRQWSEWVAPDIAYVPVCPDLPVPPD
jgi:WD40 repeat protein